MSLVSREILESEHLAEEEDGQFRGERVFEIWEDAGAAIGDAFNALAAPGIPQIGETWPVGSGIICIRREVIHASGAQMYQMLAHYESDPILLPFELSSDKDTIDIWREATPSIPTTQQPTPGLYVDIGGVAVDENGHPVQRPSHRLRFATSRLYHASTIDDFSVALAAWAALHGALNETMYHGFAPLTVMYLGPTVHQLRPTRAIVTHELLHDPRYHLVQFPERDVNGDVEKDFNVAQETWHASKVYWRRPYTSIQDIGAILGV